MIRYYEKNYGADIDGNRGIPMTFYELESSDNDEIVRLIKEAQEEGEDGDVITITMICPIYDEEVDFDITVKDYL